MENITQLSSNWKQLQQRLECGKPSGNASEKSGLKRKSRATGTKDPSDKRQKVSLPSLDKDRMENKRGQRCRSRSVAVAEKPREESISRSISLVRRAVNSEDVENEGVSSTALAGKYIALDCEMVGVGATPDEDSQLARVSIVNYHGEQVYDTYVAPKLPVTDYRTAVSGILPHHLEAGRPFKQVQADVRAFLQDRILVGHYLKSDLFVLQMKHPRHAIRDSASLPKFRDMVGRRAVKLKDITKLVLGLDIQTGEHNSVEDARAALMLYKAEKDAFETHVGKLYSSVPKQSNTLADGTANSKKKSKKKKKK